MYIKEILAIILLVAVACVMTACSFSSSSTSMADEAGNTETNTFSGEAGVSVGTDGVKVSADTTSETNDGNN